MTIKEIDFNLNIIFDGLSPNTEKKVVSFESNGIWGMRGMREMETILVGKTGHKGDFDERDVRILSTSFVHVQNFSSFKLYSTIIRIII